MDDLIPVSGTIFNQFAISICHDLTEWLECFGKSKFFRVTSCDKVNLFCDFLATVASLIGTRLNNVEQ